tara:strand:+ start:726 stop:869 length:144 start_codon:yes stop_codon:yes gene_type:complete
VDKANNGPSQEMAPEKKGFLYTTKENKIGEKKDILKKKNKKREKRKE